MKTIDVRRLLVQLTILVSITTNISAQVRADFSAPVTSGCPPLVVNFKDSSKGNPVSWKWDLGNGTISYLQNPSVAYFTPGTYNVKLVVKGVEGADSVVKRNFIVVNALPVPAFSVSDSLGCYPLKVRFGDGSVAGSGTIEKWQWDFGDGTLSNERNPVHTYTTAGSFTVILNVTNSAGCSKVVTKPAKIRVRDRITASFSYTSRDGCHSPTPVSFTNETVSTGLTTYQWHFGNGVISEEKNPVYNYKDEGVYSVKLVASNNIGCTDTLIKSDAINIGFVKADFSRPDVACTGARTQFRNISSPSSFVKAQWFFGDDSVSSLVSPTHIFVKPGVYYTKLIIDFGSCKDSIVKAITVQETPIVNFTATNNIGCKAPLTVNFTNTSGSAVAYQWNFGDGTRSSLPNPSHTYSKAMSIGLHYQ
jgi:PKD repeat protein